MRLTAFLACTVICLTTAANAQEDSYKLTGKPKLFTIGEKDEGIAIDVPGAGKTGELTIECDGKDFDCTKVAIGGAASRNVTKKSATARAVTFEIPGGSASTTFNGKVIYDGTESKNTLTFASTTLSSQPATKNAEAQLGEWLATPCEEGGLVTPATFLTTPFGRVIKQSKARINDRDRITVSILAVSDLEPILSVREGSDLATPSVTNIYGADVSIFKTTSKSNEPVRRVRCVITTPTPLGPFASPKGVVNINAHLGLEEKKVGTFQFQVSPTYTGAFSLGGGITTHFNPTFEKSFNGTDTVIVERGRHRRFLYVATYTHYIWGPRDLSFARGVDFRLYPFVGVVLNDITNNALAGVSIELQPGFAFVVAQHIARINLLDTSTGAGVGKAFKGGTIPTDQRWVAKPFYGIIIDSHAAAGLIKSLFAAPK